MIKIKEGYIVRLKGKKRKAKVVAAGLFGLNGVRVDRLLGGFRYWNAKDLEVVSKK